VVKGPEPVVKISAPGEIKKEFEESHAKLDEEVRSQHQKAEQASEQLIEMFRVSFIIC
jgi:hypothetical protein